MSIEQQYAKVKESLEAYPNVKVIAATKYLETDRMIEVVKAGITDIGENRVDTFLEKYEALKEYSLTWHFFGVMQTRKVRSVIDKIDYLHSLDTISLASEINKRTKNILKCFVQVNISGESNKSGIEESKVIPFIKSLAKYEKIQIVGLMTIAKLTLDEKVLHDYFKTMQKLQKEVQKLSLPYAPCLELSMGMSNDYLIAVEHQATMVRLGRILFN